MIAHLKERIVSFFAYGTFSQHLYVFLILNTFSSIDQDWLFRWVLFDELLPLEIPTFFTFWANFISYFLKFVMLSKHKFIYIYSALS